MPRGNISLDRAPAGPDIGYVAIPFEDGELVRRRSPTSRPQPEVKVSQFSSFTKGFGRDRIDVSQRNNPDAYRAFWDAFGVETRFPGDLRLGPLADACTGEIAAGRIVASVHFGAAFWTVWEEFNAAGTTQDVKARSLSGTTLSGGADIATEAAVADGIRCCDLQADGTNMLALVNEDIVGGATGRYYLYRSTDGVTWTRGAAIAATDALTAGSRQGNSYPLDGGLIAPADIAGERAVAVWDETGGEIEIYQTTDSGATISAAEITIASGAGPLGIAVYPGIDNTDKLYLGTREGLYEIDTSPATWTSTLLHRLPTNGFNCRRMTVHGGALWFPGGNLGVDTALAMNRMVVEGDRRVFEHDWGLDFGDAVPADMLGGIHFLESSGRFLFMSGFGNGASRNARVLCHNGEGWHSMAKNGTADEQYTWGAIGLSGSFYYAVRDDTNGYSVERIANATLSPLSGSIVTTTVGRIDLPRIGWFPDGSHWLQARIIADDLSADTSGEYVTCSHGLDGAARNINGLGDFLSDTKKLDPASGAGHPNVTSGMRLVLNRDGGTTTDTPKVHQVEMVHVDRPAPIEQFEFLISLEETAAVNDLDIEKVITNLESARDKTILPTFQYANISAKYVKVVALQWREHVESVGEADISSVPDIIARRGGVVRVVVEELIT